jgi:hypothetical protein
VAACVGHDQLDKRQRVEHATRRFVGVIAGAVEGSRPRRRGGRPNTVRIVLSSKADAAAPQEMERFLKAGGD